MKPTFWNYLMINARTSFDLFERSSLLVSVLNIVAALIAGFAISFGLIPDTVLSEGWQKGFFSIGLSLLLLFFFITPIRLWFLGQTKINALEDRLKPRLSVAFDNFNPDFQATNPEHAEGHAIRTFRIRVENTGTELLDHCCVSPDELIARNSGRRRKVDLKFRFTSDNGDSRKLGPGEYAFVDIVEMDENDSTGFFTLCYANTDIVDRIHRSEGHLQLTIKVIGGPAPVTAVYRIAVDHRGFLTMVWIK